MNKKVEDFIRQEIKTGLDMCTEKQQLLFKRMYSHKDITKPLDTIVDGMNEDKLETAMDQVERTVFMNNTKKAKESA